MNIEIVKVGKLECNCYLLGKDNKVLVIDPGDEVDKIIDKIDKREVIGVIITHYHFDHVGALDDILNKYNACVYDRSNMLDGVNQIGNFKFEVIYTPGHKEDAITIYFKEENCMFCGDFIFKNNIGRCDLPGGNSIQMRKSLLKMKKYDKDITIYPGHGDETSLENEMKNYNYYF